MSLSVQQLIFFLKSTNGLVLDDKNLQLGLLPFSFGIRFEDNFE